MQNKVKKTLFYGWWFIRFIAKMSLSLMIAPVVGLGDKYRNSWLIMELPKEARDNGYWLYKYIVENHPEVNVRYVLAEDSPDYNKMPLKEKIIRPYSWEHYLAYILCERSISTHIYGASPGRYYTKLFTLLMPRKQEVFLQHGVTKEPIPLRGFSGWTVAVSPTETEHFIKSGHKRPERIIQTGFSRYDNLIDDSKTQNQKIILIMPTFRSWLGGHTTVHRKTFLQSDFYRQWSSLLNNKEFTSWVGRNKYRVVFYPHRQMQAFNDLFEVDDGNFEVATQADYDIQDLLRKASVLITDYSGVFYDFSYMKKPVLFYAFDKERFYADHHRYSGKPYPFGVYSYDEKVLVSNIKKCAKNDFKISDEVLMEVEEFFVYTDQKNSERNYNAIKGLAE